MKRKIIASFVIALLVLTIFGAATISAAPSSISAAPNKTPKNPSVVSVGQNALWTVYNVHQAGVQGQFGTTTLTQSSARSTIKTTLNAPSPNSGGSNYALLGVAFSISGITTQAQWNAIAGRQVTVTANVGYELTGSGIGSTWTIAKFATGTIQNSMPCYGCGQLIATTQTPGSAGRSLGTASSPLTTVKLTNPLYYMGTDTPGNVMVTVQIPQNMVDSNAGATYASATVTVYDIQIQWL